MKGLDELANVVRSIFRQQRQQYQRLDKERFGDWNSRLAKELRNAVGLLYLSAARSAKAKRELAPDFEAMASARAISVAREINDTTSDWLQEGRDVDSVFGVSRVVAIATTEAVFAKNAARAVLAKSGGKRLRWKARKKACKFCQSINGKIVKPNEAFGLNAGVAVYHSPAHPHCYCEVEVVD